MYNLWYLHELIYPAKKNTKSSYRIHCSFLHQSIPIVKSPFIISDVQSLDEIIDNRYLLELLYHAQIQKNPLIEFQSSLCYQSHVDSIRSTNLKPIKQIIKRWIMWGEIISQILSHWDRICYSLQLFTFKLSAYDFLEKRHLIYLTTFIQFHTLK